MDHKYIIVPADDGDLLYDIIRGQFLTDKPYPYIGISNDMKMYFTLDKTKVTVYKIENNMEMFSYISIKSSVVDVGVSSYHKKVFSTTQMNDNIGRSTMIWNLESRTVDKRFKIEEYSLDNRINKYRQLLSDFIHVNTSKFIYADENWMEHIATKYVAKSSDFEIVCVGVDDEGWDPFHYFFYYDDYISKSEYIYEKILTGCLNNDDSYLIYLSSDGDIVFWEISTKEEKRRIHLQFTETSSMQSASFSEKSNYLVIGFKNGILNIFDVSTARLLFKLHHIPSIYIENCDFRNAIADDETLNMYGAPLMYFYFTRND